MKVKKEAKKVHIAKKLSSRKKALLAIEAGRAAKAVEPVALQVGKLVDYTDYFVILSGQSTVQVRAIFEKIGAMIASTRSPASGSEGEREGRWAVVDWGDVVIHIFHRDLRGFYELERLWADAARLKIPEEGKPAETGPS
jgi:ribosome-associated protein